MNLSLRIRRGIQRAKENGSQPGRKPIPSNEVDQMKKLRKRFSLREMSQITGYSIGVVCKYTKGAK